MIMTTIVVLIQNRKKKKNEREVPSITAKAALSFGTCAIRTCYRQEPSFAAHEYEQHKQDNSNRTNEIVAAAITEIINILIY